MVEDSYVARVSLACLLPHVILIGCFGIGLLTIWYPFVTLFTCHLEMKQDQIIGTSGWIRKKTLTSPIQKIVSIEIEETILGRIFHYGTIILSTCHDQFFFFYRKNPKQVRNELMKRMKQGGTL